MFDAEASGGFVDDGESRIEVLRVDDPPGAIDRRAVFEFDLSDLPAGAQIQSAQLELDLATLESTLTDGPTLTAYGYSGQRNARIDRRRPNDRRARAKPDGTGSGDL